MYWAWCWQNKRFREDASVCKSQPSVGVTAVTSYSSSALGCHQGS